MGYYYLSWLSWVDIFGLCSFFLISLMLYIILRENKLIKNFPPGPPRIPILGNLHQMGPEPHLTFTALQAKYGNVFSFRFGSYNGVVLNGSKTIREALSEPAFNGRHGPTIAFPRQGGIVMNESKDWADQRRFTIKTLRDLGFGKKSIESQIIVEVEELLETFGRSVGTPSDFQRAFNAAVLNSLWSMLTGIRFSHDDVRLHHLIGLLNTTIQAEGLTVMDKLSFFISWLHPLKRILPQARKISRFIRESLSMMEDVIVEHRLRRSTCTDENEATVDFVDAYLKEIKATTDPTSSFCRTRGEKNLPIVLFDLFIAGTETTSTTLTYALQYMAIHEEVQEKVFLEIENVVGLSRLPNLNDRQSLPYTEATIMEVLRHSSLLPRSLVHKTTETVNFQGFTIPKDTMIIPNLYSAMHDPSVWTDPENFRPARFISTEAGKAGSLIRHNEAYLPFSTGKRVCLGESLAKDQLFLFFGSLLQRYRVTADPKSPPLKVEYYVTPLILSPIPKLLVLHDRNSSITSKKYM